jgi:hypothetical protein
MHPRNMPLSMGDQVEFFGATGFGEKGLME